MDSLAEDIPKLAQLPLVHELAENMIGISVAQKHPTGGATLNNKFDILARQAIVE